MSEKKWYQDAKVIMAVIIAVVITAFITYLIAPKKTVTETHATMVADTGKAAQRQAQEMTDQFNSLSEDIGWIKRTLKLAQNQQPVSGGVTNPSTPPINETPIPKPADTSQPVKPAVLYAYDLPLSGEVTKSKIRFMTLNPYLQYMNLPYLKTYEFDRQTSDFEFATSETRNPDLLDGIKLRTEERFFSFDGLTVGTGVMLSLSKERDFYALMEAQFSMYERLHIIPRITSIPQAGMELKYDIIK
jgi:hypothetical protein